MIEFVELGLRVFIFILIYLNILAKRGGFCGLMGPRLSVNKDLEKVFKDYVQQVKNPDNIAYDKEEEKNTGLITHRVQTIQASG